MPDSSTFDYQALDYGLSGSNNVAKTIDLPEVTIKAKNNNSSSLLSRIKSLFTSKKSQATPKVSVPKGNTPVIDETSSNGSNFSWANFSTIFNSASSITGSVFGFLGQQEETKRSQLALQGLEKQKEIAVLENQTETFIASLNGEIELQKARLIETQKADRIKSITRVALVFGGLFFLGFIVYLVFKRSDTQIVPAQTAVPAPVPLV